MGRQRQRSVELAQLWHDGGQVARLDARLGDGAPVFDGLGNELIILQLVFGAQGVGFQMAVGQGDMEFGEQRSLLVGIQIERQPVELQSRLLGKRDSLHTQVDLVVGEMVEHQVAAQVAQAQVIGVELPLGHGGVELVVGQRAVAHDERTDVQVERTARGVVLRGKRVEYELEIGLAVGRGLVEAGFQTEQLGRGDGYAAFEQGGDVEFGREARGAQHRFVRLVENLHVIDDNAVEQPHVNMSYPHGGAEFFANGNRHLLADE